MDKLVQKQIDYYKRGFPFLDVIAPATPSKGILLLDESSQNEVIEKYLSFAKKHKIVKFVPASGAASRMFKDLFEGREILERGERLRSDSPALMFINSIHKFPFYDSSFRDLPQLEILNKVLDETGLNYGSLPKGCIQFHRYEDEVRTAFEEHLVEGAMYAICSGDIVNIHFTVSPEHLDSFKKILISVQDKYQKRFKCKYEISFSEQDPSTDIIAVNEDNTPFLKDDGTPLFRPGGHGALLHNLNAIDGDIIFLKNIDNVVNQKYINETVRWKQIISGVLIRAKERVDHYLEELDKQNVSNSPSEKLNSDIISFLDETFSITIPKIPQELLPLYLHAKLNRPIRVCGMVKNEGEPGGGPFIVYDGDGSTSLQILESAQLDHTLTETANLLSVATHFNPVDIVCSTTNYKGEKFDLNKYVDESTGFISSKSYQGRKLKAQELPGLWNGSMSNWNTIFVETPLITFNPVKTILDLLRKEHQ